ncbi:MAG: ABC transporter ATP-binding protein [Gammaproteobacteria bacterium]|uniref:ABC transporter ATP-binding protein n=1 Tax=Candidatus Thiopontia autotrophica TaxID=2841688 RepID=A0A8J6NV88_9GAMM|nr:ABC transporter ATP-binding protein [Candidatus Thiopontia autotrophica]
MNLMSPQQDEILRIKNLSSNYGDQTVLSGIDITLKKGALASLLGPSGCGKSTLLNVVAGFHDLKEGEVWVGQTLASSVERMVPPERRNIGMIFQDYALFPHLSILDNVTFGIRDRSKSDAKREANEWLDLVRMEGFGGRYPHELSGGQQQRVALARALAAKPSLLLMDEPFSNLDTDLRRRLVREIRDLLKERGITAILVTHDQEEAFLFGEEVGLIDQGVLQQWGTPEQVYTEPNNRWVANFVGDGSWIPGKVLETGEIKTSVGSFVHSFSNGVDPEQQEVEVLFRPHEIRLELAESSEDGVCHVVRSEFSGQEMHYLVESSESDQIRISMEGLSRFHVGDRVKLLFQEESLILF